MKKLLSLALLTAILLTFASCGGTDKASILGVYAADSRTYENKFIGISCQLGEEWDVFDADQMAELNGMVAELLTDEAAADKLEKGGYVLSFYAQVEEGLVTVNIAVENLGVLYGSLLSEQEYAEKSVEQLPSAFEALGMTDVTTEIGKISFAGSEHVAIYATGSLQGVPFYETLVCVKVDRYVACITAGSYFTNTTGDTLAMFKSL